MSIKLSNRLTMNEVFEYGDYREFIKSRSSSSPTGAKRSGELKRIANAARIFPSYLSQILNGRRDLTLDQAIMITDYLNLDDPERKYFLCLVQLSRAVTARLKDSLLLDLKEMRQAHIKLSSRLPNQKEISISDACEFYSSWYYIAIRLFTAIPQFQTLENLVLKFGLAEKKIKKILKFLIRTKLCTEDVSGKLSYGPAHMHLPSDNPLVTKHHSNWRAFAMEKHALLDQSKELAYSGVFVLSRIDAQEIRKQLPTWIERVRETSDPSASEVAYCLNLDWLEL